ncbi:hypothetical protein HW130_19600 [Streptomyces sp. PKU-EA00015]|uniref:hypothetical protein n=1 Tax=Streptomyces sp. PKU-EA00015 TaxID=2748326 RepID=UPI0015A2A61D|nr:hypothetical protein [Streptomyces sp. PKU-EA00015]NWF28446.1 hypothetical protein [Streptomyces sp. PKU-EA00015]
MPDAPPSRGHLSGQLYATLRALEALGAAHRKLEELRPNDKVWTSPLKWLPGMLGEAGDHLVRARRRGRAHGAAADELFRAIPDCLPPKGELPGFLSDGEPDRFDEGYRLRMAAYTAAHGALLE